jgi:hypothetical protein
MSFEIYLQCFNAGEPAGVPVSSVRALFPVVDPESEPDYWFVRYDNLNSCNISITPLASDGDMVKSVCVHRPCGDPRLWEALLNVMRLGPIVLYFPGDSPPLIAEESVAAQLPRDLREALGKPLCIGSGQEILQAIEGG